MRPVKFGAAVLFGALSLGCVSISSTNGPSATVTPPAAVVGQPPAARATPNGAQPGSSQGMCALFTPDEIAGYVGSAVDSGLANATINDCVWSATAGDGYVLVQRVPASYYEEHTLDPGYHKVDGIGEKASMTKALLGEGLALTVLQGDSAYFVDLVPATDDQPVIDLARQFIARYEAL